MSQKVRVFGFKTLFLKRFTVRSTTRTLIIDKTDHSLSLHSYLNIMPEHGKYLVLLNLV
jgi:hypothetical protein